MVEFNAVIANSGYSHTHKTSSNCTASYSQIIFSPHSTSTLDHHDPDLWVWDKKEWMSFWPCFSDRAVSLWVLAGGAAGMLAGRHDTLAHLPSHLTLPNEWKPQPVLQNLHPTAGNTHISYWKWTCLHKTGVQSSFQIRDRLCDNVCPLDSWIFSARKCMVSH